MYQRAGRPGECVELRGTRLCGPDGEQVGQPINGKLSFRGSSFGATHGYRFGGNAAWTARASMAQLAAFCYTGNSHVKPMLQIIDSDGGFHGLVAVEASLSQTVPDQGAGADDIGVFEISEFS